MKTTAAPLSIITGQMAVGPPKIQLSFQMNVWKWQDDRIDGKFDNAVVDVCVENK